MSREIIDYKRGPEAIIQEKIISKLRSLKWSVRNTHGNMYQRGWPDLFAANRMYGTRWIEVKDPKRRGNIFTNAQHEYFTELTMHGCGVWVLTSADDDEIEKLFKGPNWYTYLQIMQ